MKSEERKGRNDNEDISVEKGEGKVWRSRVGVCASLTLFECWRRKIDMERERERETKDVKGE